MRFSQCCSVLISSGKQRTVVHLSTRSFLAGEKVSLEFPVPTTERTTFSYGSPLILDPPFTSVSGEFSALEAIMNTGASRGSRPAGELWYLCAGCGAPVFSSTHTHGASLAEVLEKWKNTERAERSGFFFLWPSLGWPTFRQSWSSTALVYRTIRQCQVLSTSRREQGVLSDRAALNRTTTPDAKIPTSGGVCRRLPVEWDDISPQSKKCISRSRSVSPLVVALRDHRKSQNNRNSRPVTPLSPLLLGPSHLSHHPVSGDRPWRRTRRERSLRDVNQRADPSWVEGCCSGCGASICRISPLKKRNASGPQTGRDAGVYQQHVYENQSNSMGATDGNWLFISTANVLRATVPPNKSLYEKDNGSTQTRE